MSGALSQVPAVLSEAVETETACGGRTRSFAAVTTVWATLKLSAPDEQSSADRPPQSTESATAIARDHPDAAAGQQFAVAGEPAWTVRAVRRSAPVRGAMTLVLDRLL